MKNSGSIGSDFLLNLFGVIVNIVFCFCFKKENQWHSYLVIILTLFMWCLQSTRSFHLGELSDWAGNYYNFHNAAITDTLTYLFHDKGIYLGKAFNPDRLLSSLTEISYANFIVALTYMFTFAAIYKFWNYIQADPRFLVASCAYLLLWTEVNGICNNLLRQQFAMSMMLYAIIERCTNGRILYPLLVISFFTHTMTGFFIPFLFIRLGKKASFRFYIYIVLGFGLLYILFTNLSIFSSSSFYAFQRVITLQMHDALKDIIQPSAVYPFLAVTVILLSKRFDSERRKCELYINNLFLILISMCLLMTSMPLMQTRYFIIWFFHAASGSLFLYGKGEFM